MIKALLFDLGGTLAYDESGGKLVEKAYHNVVRYLSVMGYDVTVEDFMRTHLEVCEELREEIKGKPVELDMIYSYWQTLKRLGIAPKLPLVKGCIEAYYLVKVSSVKFFPDVVPTLERVKSLGLKTAIVSNANIGFDYVVARLNLRKYFDVLVASYRITKKKPHPLIFTKALEFLGVDIDESVMIGDSLNADIIGAKSLGIKAIWIVRRDINIDDLIKGLKLKPDAVIRSLDELFNVVELGRPEKL